MDESRSSGWTDDVETSRPLGRGLEDVSHLFLSQPGASTGRSGMGPPASERAESRPRTGGVTPLRRVEGISRAQLAAMMRDRNLGLEDGLAVLDESVPCAPCGDMDLLCLDRASQLTVIDFDVETAEALLMRGLSHVDWVVRNLPLVRRMYAGRAINFSAIPRLLLLAPEFTPPLLRVAHAVSNTTVDCVKYHVVQLPNGFGILFERLPSS
jgi:hypothetical protein